MDALMFFTVRLCLRDMHLTGRRKKGVGDLSIQKHLLTEISIIETI